MCATGVKQTCNPVSGLHMAAGPCIWPTNMRCMQRLCKSFSKAAFGCCSSITQLLCGAIELCCCVPRCIIRMFTLSRSEVRLGTDMLTPRQPVVMLCYELAPGAPGC